MTTPCLPFDQPMQPVQKPLTPVQVELKRRHGKYLLVLERLRKGPALNRELAAIAGFAFGQRKRELSADGYDIKVENLGNGLFRYTLISEPKAGTV